jgi:hypothetical protein
MRVPDAHVLENRGNSRLHQQLRSASVGGGSLYKIDPSNPELFRLRL